MRPTIITLLLIVLTCLNVAAQANSDIQRLLISGGDIVTMAGEAPEYAEALVVEDDKIVFVGNLAKAQKVAGRNARAVDLKGQTLLPGFIDGHAHFSNFSLQAVGALLLPSPDAMADDVDTIIATLKAWDTPENRALTGWIYGSGFDDSVIEEKRFLTRHDLDKVATDFPVMVVHISGHFAMVNSKGLEVLGITADTPDPEGGIIRREEGSSEPNGVLEELAAIPFMVNALTPKTPEAIGRFFEAGQEMAVAYGYTTAQDGRVMGGHQLLAALAEAGKLKIDVVSYIDYLFADKFMDSKWLSADYTNNYRIGGMKITLDGSPQGRTAWRTKPYLIPPYGADEDYAGYPAIPNDDDLIALYEKALTKNWQVLTHANGDGAMDQMIRTLQPLAEKYDLQDRRFVLIHGQYVREDQLDSFKDLDVIASLFPLHTFYWGDWHKQLIGEELGNNISPVRTALDKGLKVTIHTDAPVALPNLMRAVWTAVSRTSRSGAVIGEDQRLTPYEALKAITQWSAYQHFEEQTKGTLEVGKLADMVVLDANPLKVEVDAIKEIQVMRTFKSGQQVFERK